MELKKENSVFSNCVLKYLKQLFLYVARYNSKEKIASTPEFMISLLRKVVI
jgi:hypothetical protein